MKNLTLALTLSFITACGSSQNSGLQSQNAIAHDDIIMSPEDSAVVINILLDENVATEYLPGPIAKIETLWMVKSLFCNVGYIELTSPHGNTYQEANSCNGVTYYDKKVDIAGENAKTLALTLAKAGVPLNPVFGLNLKALAASPLICTFVKTAETDRQQFSCRVTPRSI